jgi:hypothetical protein
MNRFGTIVSTCVFDTFDLDQPLRVDMTRHVWIAGKRYDCPPCHSQDNWSDDWVYAFELGLCTMLGNQTVFRPVVNIDK